MACNCDLCKLIAEYRKHIENVPEPAKTFFEAMFDRYLETDMDLDYYKAIVKNQLDGADAIIAKYRKEPLPQTTKASE